MDKPPPGKIIQMTMGTGHKETRRNRLRLAFLGLGAVVVVEMCPLWVIGVMLDFEDVSVVFAKASAVHAPQPGRERSDWHTDKPL